MPTVVNKGVVELTGSGWLRKLLIDTAAATEVVEQVFASCNKRKYNYRSLIYAIKTSSFVLLSCMNLHLLKQTKQARQKLWTFVF